MLNAIMNSRRAQRFAAGSAEKLALSSNSIFPSGNYLWSSIQDYNARKLQINSRVGVISKIDESNLANLIMNSAEISLENKLACDYLQQRCGEKNFAKNPTMEQLLAEWKCSQSIVIVRHQLDRKNLISYRCEKC